jgi:threonine aldolase
MAKEEEVPGRRMKRCVDLRSDALSQPTEEMFAAMKSASNSDDVFDRNGTMERLHQIASRMLGKEDALFVSSGTMGNLIAIIALTSPGDGIILDRWSHVALSEPGVGAFASVHATQLTSRRGLLDPDEISEAALRQSQEGARPRLLILENTHNVAGGIAVTPRDMEIMSRVAHELSLAVHLDGARLFNAAVGLGVSPAELAAPCDTVMISLSKGLCAPSGAVLLGTSEFIAKARRIKKMLGGPRQDGILAAAGIVALTSMVEGLKRDHERARMLEGLLADIGGIDVEVDGTRTNIVFFQITTPCTDAVRFTQELARRGVLALPFGRQRVRMVLYRDITDDDVRVAVRAVRDVMASCQ